MSCGKRHLTADEFGDFLHQFAVAERMERRCFEMMVQAFDAEDPLEFRRLISHWSARYDYWQGRRLQLRAEAKNYTIAEDN